METNYLYLVLNDQEVFSAVVSANGRQVPLVKDGCRIPCPDLLGTSCAAGQDTDEVQSTETPSEAPEEKNTRQESFALAMEEAASRLDISSCICAVIFFPTHWVDFRILCLPFENSGKVRQILDLELERCLLPRKENLISDFYSLGSSQNGFQICIGSLSGSFLQSCVKTLKSFGLSFDMAVPFGCAVAQGFLDSRTDSERQTKGTEKALLVIREENRLTFVLILNSCVHTIRSRPVVAETYCDMVRSRIREMIAGACQQFGMDVQVPVFLCLDEDDVLQETCTALTEIPGVSEVASWPDWKNWSLSLNLERSHPNMLQFLRSGNRAGKFLGHLGRFFAKYRGRQYRAGLGICAGLLAGIFLIFFLGTLAKNASYSRAIETLDSQARTLFLQTFPGTKHIRDPYLQMKANVGAVVKKNGGRGVPQPSFTATQILNELSVKMDSSMDIVISRFLLREGKLILAGTTNDFNNVDTMKTLLESSDLFRKVTISSASADKGEKRVKFRFVIEIQGLL